MFSVINNSWALIEKKNIYICELYQIGWSVKNDNTFS